MFIQVGVIILLLSLSLPVRPIVNISATPENNSFPIGANITLNCKAKPRTKDEEYMDRWVKYIEWHDPRGGDVRARCEQPSNSRAELSCPLVLKNLTVAEFGRYICQAGNEYRRHCTRKSFELRILGKKLIIPLIDVVQMWML